MKSSPGLRTRNAGEDDYQVTFAPSTAHEPAPRGNLGVKVWPFFRTSKPNPEEKRAADGCGSQAGGQHHPGTLARGGSSRAEAGPSASPSWFAPHPPGLIARRLRKAGIPFRAVEIEQLGERQEVKDLTALTRALLHPMDRIAWLTVLRAPWCGLTSGTCIRSAAATPRTIPTRMLTLLRERTPLLSEDGQQRAARALRCSKTRCAANIARSRWRDG
jgi:hypothetical protein